MKKVFTLLMAITYLLLIVGVPISVHHCHGDSQWQISGAEENAHHCATTYTPEKESCCSHDHMATEQITATCQIDHHEMGCCTHEEKIIKWSSNQQITSVFKISFKAISFQLLHAFSNELEEIDGFANNYIPWVDFAPPNSKSLQVLLHRFTFYG